ncbi:MAG: class I SAM-dependent methyltransferase [Paracoccaceae bacterium]
MILLSKELEAIAKNYHLSSNIKDKFIEDACQHYCCEWLSSLIKPDDSVLELGYGEGLTLATLKKKTSDYTVVEGSYRLYKRVQELHPDVQAEYSLFENFEGQRSYDKILALHVLEHVTDPVETLRHSRNWMHLNSELIVIVPNRNSLHRKLALEMGLISSTDELSERDKVVGHQRVYSIQNLRTDLEVAGFELLGEQGFFLKPFPNSMMLEFSDEMIMALNTISSKLPVDLMANIGLRAKIKA